MHRADRVTWRPVQATDRAAVMSAWAALNREDPAESPPPLAYIERTWACLLAEPHRGCIAVLDLNGEVCGYALLISMWGNEQGGEVCVIDELYVAPHVRSRGHAKALIEAIGAGKTSIWPRVPVALQLEVSPKNFRAQALYTRLGFRLLRNAVMRRTAVQSLF